MKEKIKEMSVYVLFIVIGLLCFFALCERAEQIDKQKELPVATQSNSMNF